MMQALQLRLLARLPELDLAAAGPRLLPRLLRLGAAALAMLLWSALFLVLVRLIAIRAFWGFDPWLSAHWVQAYDAFLAGWVLDSWREVAFLLSPLATLWAWIASARLAGRAGAAAVRRLARPPASRKHQSGLPLPPHPARRATGAPPPAPPPPSAEPRPAPGTQPSLDPPGAQPSPAPTAEPGTAPAQPAERVSEPSPQGEKAAPGPGSAAAAVETAAEASGDAVPAAAASDALAAWAATAGWTLLPAFSWPVPEDASGSAEELDWIDPADCRWDAALLDAGALWLVRRFDEPGLWIPRDGDPAYDGVAVWELAAGEDAPAGAGSGIEVSSPVASVAAAREAFRRLYGARLRERGLAVKALVLVERGAFRPDPADDPALACAAEAWLDMDVSVAVAAGGAVDGLDMVPGRASDPAEPEDLDGLLQPDAEDW